MKRTGLVPIIFLFVSVVLFPADQVGFDGIVDFSITLESISEILTREGPDALPRDKLIVLTGAISSLQVLQSGEESPFLAELELVGGEWVGMEAVKMYTCLVLLHGDDFQNRIPVRRSRREIVNEITLNSEVMVVGKVVGTRTLYTGEQVPVIEAFYVRTLG